MLDLRPVGYVVGLLIVALGCAMIVPMIADLANEGTNWDPFAVSAAISVFTGGAMAAACADRRTAGLSIQQAFLFTTLAWLLLPVFGGLPFVLGQPNASYVDGFFEAMSGLTTTGATVFRGLDELPQGVNLWRGMLQWFGGVGIVVFAMAFLPTLRVGGMQLFKSESFDTFGKILPRAAEIAQSISWIYVGLTAVCAVSYVAAGMSTFDATMHAMTTVSTGGFASRDASFGAFSPMAQYLAVVFMILAALPFVRFVQIMAGSARPLFKDPQIHAFIGTALAAVIAMAAYRSFSLGSFSEEAFRASLFNVVSILTGTGYASADYSNWGAFPVALIFIIGLIGGCAGSTSCSIKVFRYQVLFAAVVTQINRLHMPHGVFTPRYAGRPVEEDVISSVMSFVFFFFLTFGAVAVILSMIGLDTITAISGAASAIANIGPGLGPEIGPAGTFQGLPDSAKWVLAITMLIGRLELLAVFVLFTPTFWRP
ncbi:MAG: TrkH family potassium uptake protein [Pseudomonadota bacterium]